MSQFVLVHGAWAGAWCWQRVLPHLYRDDPAHRVHAVTLTGVGERAHLLTPEVGLSTHVQDVLALIEAEELDDFVLAVHSYGGMVGTGVADRIAHKIRHLVYVDAVLPKPGEAWGSTHAKATHEARLGAAALRADRAFPSPDATAFGLDGEDGAWVNRRQTPHPSKPYTDVLEFDPVRVAAVPRTFVSCVQPVLATIEASRQRLQDPGFWGGAWAQGGGCRVVTLATGHDPMVSEPATMARILLDASR